MNFAPCLCYHQRLKPLQRLRLGGTGLALGHRQGRGLIGRGNRALDSKDRYSMLHCGMVGCIVVCYSKVHCGLVHYGIMMFGTVGYVVVWYGRLHCGMFQLGTLWHSTVG